MSIFRRLTLIHDGRTFLRRHGIGHPRIGGVYLHRLDEADPGLDTHDHPWSFVSVILRGGYVEHIGQTWSALWQIRAPRRWRRWSIHRMRREVPHRIDSVEPGTITLVLRGPRRRSWGFYTPDGWVDHEDYDYEMRRPASETR